MKPKRAARRAVPAGLLLALAITLLGRGILPLAAYQSHDEPRVFLAQDSYEYLDLARSLAGSADYATNGQAELRRLPGFPMLLAIGAGVGHPVLVTLVLHLLLGLSTTVLCFAIASRLAGPRAASAAAILFACATELWVWNSYLLSETLFVFLFAAMLWSAVRYEGSSEARHLLLAIVLACGAAYVRVVGYPLPFVLVLWFAVLGRRDRQALKRAAAALVVAVTLLGAWHVRNGLTAGYWGFSSQVERAMYFLGGSAVETRHGGASYYEARRRLEAHLGEGGSGPDDEASISDMRSRGLSAVAEHPVSFAASYGIGILAVLVHSNAGYLFRLFDADPAEGRAAVTGLHDLTRGRWGSAARYWRERGPAYSLIFLLQVAQVLFYYLLCGLAFRRPRAPSAVGLVIMPALCLLLLSGGDHGNARYRAPLVPAICVLAGIGLTRRNSPSPAPTRR